MATVDKSQVEIAERLQMAILEDFEKILEDGSASATDRATIVRFLQANGWTVDPAQIPENLKGMLTKGLPEEEETPGLSLAK